MRASQTRVAAQVFLKKPGFVFPTQAGATTIRGARFLFPDSAQARAPAWLYHGIRSLLQRPV